MVKFGKYPAYGDAQSLAQYAIDGYKTGLNWSRGYRPGGPYCTNAQTRDYGEAALGNQDRIDYVKYCEHTVTGRDLWLECFDVGLRDQMAAKKLKVETG